MSVPPGEGAGMSRLGTVRSRLNVVSLCDTQARMPTKELTSTVRNQPLDLVALVGLDGGSALATSARRDATAQRYGNDVLKLTVAPSVSLLASRCYPRR